MSLQKQGANNGAVTAFLISTPESGVDSIAVTYALLDPILTVARPVIAFITAAIAGILENFSSFKAAGKSASAPNLSCPVDGCCDGTDCEPEAHRSHHSFLEKIYAGLGYSFTELWEDLAKWFFIGLVLAGMITAFIPDDFISQYLGAGFPAMLVMLVVGIPLYICATASTPIAAALILKGISPGAALVFLLAGPATNITSLTVLVGVLGNRATAIYLTTIAICTVLFGMLVDQIYSIFGVSAQATVRQASEIVPAWMETTGAVALILLSIKPIVTGFRNTFKTEEKILQEEVQIESDTQIDTDTCGST